MDPKGSSSIAFQYGVGHNTPFESRDPSKRYWKKILYMKSWFFYSSCSFSIEAKTIVNGGLFLQVRLELVLCMPSICVICLEMFSVSDFGHDSTVSMALVCGISHPFLKLSSIWEWRLINNGISASCWWLPSRFKAASLVTLDSRGEEKRGGDPCGQICKPMILLKLYFIN